MTTDDRITVSFDDACRVSDLSRATMAKLVASGEVASVKVGRRRLIRLDSLEALLGGAE